MRKALMGTDGYGAPAVQLPNPKPVVKDDELYIGDNGAVNCGAHLGATARFTGHDLSGQAIHRITPADVVAMKNAFKCDVACETCGAAVPVPANVKERYEKDNRCEHCAHPIESVYAAALVERVAGTRGSVLVHEADCMEGFLLNLAHRAVMSRGKFRGVHS